MSLDGVKPTDITLNAETLSFYQENKEALNKILKDEGSRFLNAKSNTGYVGLINQAATCYLNSLIQTLYTTPELRRCLYSFRHNENLHGPAERCIPLQLQLLFAKLQFGARPAVSTEDLTKSFGWSKSQGATQQDVQELCMVLFDALDRSLAHGEAVQASINKTTNNKSNTRMKITDLYRGMCYNYIRGEKFKGKYYADPFLTLSLPIKGQKDVIEALKKSFEPDKLEGDNQYYCEELGKKVDAEKGSCIDRLPPILMLHLKRFDFDYETMRRIKINDSCEIPEIIDMDDVLQNFRYNSRDNMDAKGENGSNDDDGKAPTNENTSNENTSDNINAQTSESKSVQPLGKYQLVSVMNHSGTSRGGHYRAFIRGDRSDNTKNWYDFNDACVSEMTENEVNSLFGRNVEENSGKSNKSSSNAYLLCYRKLSKGNNNSIKKLKDGEFQLLPESVQEFVDNERSNYLKLHRTFNIKQLMTEMRVFTSGAIGTVQAADLTIDFPLSHTLQAVTVAVYTKIFSAGKENGVTIDRVRLRKFDAHASAAGKTFGGKELMTLKELNFGLSCTMMLEVREENESFEEYNPNEMLVRVSTWDFEKQMPNSNTSKIVRVDGDQQATVGALRKAIEKATGVEPTKHRIIRMNANSAVVLDDDEKIIKKHFSIWSGEEVIIEPVHKDEDSKESYRTSYNSSIIKTYEDKRNRVSINFNKPGDKIFENCIIIDKRKSLLTLKQAIAETLNLQDMNKFRLKLHARAPVLKNLEKSMNESNLSDGSVVFVEKGVQPKAGEMILLFYRYMPNQKEPFKAISKALFSADTKVRDVKIRISKHPKAKGHPPEKLRLRIRGKTGKDVGAILRDDQTLGASVKRLCDNDKFAVQFLDTEEVVTSKDAIISFLLWRPIMHKLGKKIETVVSKYISTSDLQETLSTIYRDKFIDSEDNQQKHEFRVAKLRTLGGINAKVVHGRTMSGKGIQWIGLNKVNVPDTTEIDVSSDNNMGENLLVMKTDIGRLIDGTNLLIVDTKELNDAIEQATKKLLSPQSPNTSQQDGNNRPRPPPPRNSRFSKDGANNVVVFPKRREVGVKIATVFDSPIKKVDEKSDSVDLANSTKSVVETESIEDQRRRLFDGGDEVNNDKKNGEVDQARNETANLDDSVVLAV